MRFLASVGYSFRNHTNKKQKTYCDAERILLELTNGIYQTTAILQGTIQRN